ncbi:MAG: DUF3343 domain-containing protein [Clostridia bacterium]|nr:DUF3343 domain-containing protein [Clostridia bacterium]
MYLITFHSQFDSNLFKRKMQVYGKVTQKPVPRTLSSSCGTCCVLEPADPDFSFEKIPDVQYEKIYSVTDTSEYVLIAERG